MVRIVLVGRLPQWSLLRALVSLVNPADPQAVFAALVRFELQDKQYERVDRFSGGERQRCSMARLFLSEASWLLGDEPLSALDSFLMQAALVCSLHQVELARECFARIIGLRDGRIVLDAPRELISAILLARTKRASRCLRICKRKPPRPMLPHVAERQITIRS